MIKEFVLLFKHRIETIVDDLSNEINIQQFNLHHACQSLEKLYSMTQLFIMISLCVGFNLKENQAYSSRFSPTKNIITRKQSRTREEDKISLLFTKLISS